MKILVTGGAGYIGSHMVRMLLEQGVDVVVIDNFSTGNWNEEGRFIEGNFGDMELLEKIFSTEKFDGVIHLAASSSVEESVLHPVEYYKNNVLNTLNLLDVMIKYGVSKFIFSSTAAVYGEPDYFPIDEKHKVHPVNPYGQTKLFIEETLKFYEEAYGLSSVSLRFFNAAGASPCGSIGENRAVETHLIPIILKVAKGIRKNLSIFGTNYNTKDGTCKRDYVHVSDLCNAHTLALKYIDEKPGSHIFNLGTGSGYSVKEVIDTVEKVTGKEITVESKTRRAGDPEKLVANYEKAFKHLGWKPLFGLKEIIQHSWNWEQNLQAQKQRMKMKKNAPARSQTFDKQALTFSAI
ncbi:MAG: UDP-glucose 4-epimerase GalE [Deltaproteobacteria bacterium]|nr:UDP-glucose 4-epimerase GalE [Deltaproteobacteria bacterium]